VGWQPVREKDTILNILANEVVVNVDMFGTDVKVCLLGQRNGAGIIDIEDNGERHWDMEGCK
jgi:hypothetical protein